MRRPNGSRPLAQCVGPFPFTTGSLQIVSAGLLELIASSVGAAAHIARAVELANLGRGPDDHMEFLAGATPLVGALEIDGRLERSGDEDVFSFRSPGNETQVFRLTFPSGAIGDVTLDLVGRDGKTVLRPWDRDYATYVRFPFSNPGMYYLRVRGRLTSGHYRITREIRSP